MNFYLQIVESKQNQGEKENVPLLKEIDKPVPKMVKIKHGTHAKRPKKNRKAKRPWQKNKKGSRKNRNRKGKEGRKKGKSQRKPKGPKGNSKRRTGAVQRLHWVYTNNFSLISFP